MAQRRCYGCMGLTDQPVCGSCGTPEEEQNLPHQLPRGTSLAGRFLVGKALGEPVKLLEFYPANAARRDGTAVEPDGAAFARRKVRFCRVSEALSRDSRLTEVSGTEMTFEENGTCYSRYVALTALRRNLENPNLFNLKIYDVNSESVNAVTLKRTMKVSPARTFTNDFTYSAEWDGKQVSIQFWLTEAE